MPQIELQPGEKKFLEQIENHPEAKKVFQKGKKETKEFLRERINELKKEILSFPEIQEEQKIHFSDSIDVDLIAEAVNISLEKGVEDGLKLVMKRGDAHLIDLFHDTLAGHFLEKLIQLGRVKTEEPSKVDSFFVSIITFIIVVGVTIILLIIFWEPLKSWLSI